jgi:hypothetical protein
MPIQPTVAKIFQVENISIATIRLLIIIGAVFAVIMFTQKCNPTPKLDQKALAVIAAKQDSLLRVLKAQDKVLADLQAQRDQQKILDNQLLSRQITIANNIKNLQHEYQNIKTFTLSRASIYQFYIDSLREYKPY